MTVAAISAMPVSAEGADAASVVYYSGERLDSDTPYLLIGKAPGAASTTVKASAQDTDSDGTWTLLAQFDAQSGTLTFKSGRDITNNPWEVGMPLKQIDADGDGDASNDKYYGIYANGSLTVELGNYVNLLYLGRQSPSDFGQEGIHIEGDLTVNGMKKGMLRVTANPAGKKNGGLQSYGVYASGTVTLNGGVIDVYETTYNLGYFHLEHNYTTLIKANDISLSGGSLYLRARNNSASLANNKKLYETESGEIYVPDSYEKKWATEFEYAPDSSATDQDRTKGNDGNENFHEGEQENDRYVRLEPAAGYEITIFNNADAPIALSGDAKYLVKSGEGYAASERAGGAYAEYDAGSKTLYILQDTELNVASDSYRTDMASSCIYSDGDLTVSIPEDVTLTLSGQNNGRNKNLRAKGNITICGEGRIKAFACKDYLGTSENSAAIWSDSGNVTIKERINANLYTRELSSGQIAHVIYAGGHSVEIGAYTTVKMGTDLGKLFNDGTDLTVYDTAEAKMAQSAETKTAGAEPKSELIDYNKSDVANMKYLSVAPMPMLLERTEGFDSRGLLPMSRPELELVFNLDIASVPSVSDLSIDNGAEIAGISADGKKLKITLGGVKAGGEYTLKIKNVKNAAGLEYADEYSFKASDGCDVLSVTLNGSECGSVGASNDVCVTLSKADSVPVMNAVVTAVVWEKVNAGEKSVLRLKSASSQQITDITGIQKVNFDGIKADAGNVIRVFVWDSLTGVKSLCRAAEFVG